MSEETKEANAVNERLGKILVSALAAPDDVQTVSAMAALRRALSGTGAHITEVRMYREGDRSSQGRGYSMVKEYMEMFNNEQTKNRVYRERLAVLEAAFLQIKRIIRPIPGIDKDDYRLKMATETADARAQRAQFDE